MFCPSRTQSLTLSLEEHGSALRILDVLRDVSYLVPEAVPRVVCIVQECNGQKIYVHCSHKSLLGSQQKGWRECLGRFGFRLSDLVLRSLLLSHLANLKPLGMVLGHHWQNDGGAPNLPLPNFLGAQT